MDLVNQFLELAKAHAWLPLIALVLGFVVRMSKSDAIGPVVPAKYRPWLAWVLGAATFVVDSLMGGAPVSAIIYGFGAPLLAILGHKLGIEKLRDGEEIQLPKMLMRKPDGTIGKGGMAALLLLVTLCLPGCASFGKFTDGAKSVLSVLEQAAQLLCLVASSEKVGKPVEEIKDDCCRTLEEISPWLDAAKAGARAGAVKAGMSAAPLTPANAEPQLKDPELEERK